MQDLTLATEQLRDELADIHHEIAILEQITRKLISMVDDADGAGPDRVCRHLGEINRRKAAALARQTSISRLLEECGRVRRQPASGAARARRQLPARPTLRPMKRDQSPAGGDLPADALIEQGEKWTRYVH